MLSFGQECQERLESTGDAGRTPPLSAFDSQSRADCFRIACVSSARNEEGRTRSYSTHTQAQGRQAPLRPAGADKGLRGGERKSFHWITSLAGGKGGISPHIYLISKKKRKMCRPKLKIVQNSGSQLSLSRFAMISKTWAMDGRREEGARNIGDTPRALARTGPTEGIEQSSPH